MPINSLKFLQKFIIKYDREIDLPTDIVADIVATVLLDAPEQYFNYNMVQEHPEFCKKCGMCCRQRGVECEHFNGRTCDDYVARFNNCAEFPFYDIDGERGLLLDPGCQFAMKLAEMVLDKEMQKEVDSFKEVLS